MTDTFPSAEIALWYRRFITFFLRRHRRRG
jgi:hypothetical protein